MEELDLKINDSIWNYEIIHKDKLIKKINEERKINVMIININLLTQ
jgi:hypothetical protein